MDDHSIDGKWRGHYSYRGRPDDGSGFDANFKDGTDGLSGEITDDFPPGPAILRGSFSYPHVKFTKVYLKTNENLPIAYEGTMSGDGKSMRGTWKIEAGQYSTTGMWTAYRSTEEPRRAKETDKSKVKELDEVEL